MPQMYKQETKEETDDNNKYYALNKGSLRLSVCPPDFV